MARHIRLLRESFFPLHTVLFHLWYTRFMKRSTVLTLLGAIATFLAALGYTVTFTLSDEAIPPTPTQEVLCIQLASVTPDTLLVRNRDNWQAVSSLKRNAPASYFLPLDPTATRNGVQYVELSNGTGWVALPYLKLLNVRCNE